MKVSRAGIIVLFMVLSLFPVFGADVQASGGAHDHGLFCTCSSPADTAVYAGVVSTAKKKQYYTLHIAARTDDSAGTFVIHFKDSDTMGFPVPANTSFSTTQALGGVPGVDDIVKITVTGGVFSMMVSVDADPGAIDPFDETLDGAAADKHNFVVTAPSEAGATSAALVFGE